MIKKMFRKFFRICEHDFTAWHDLYKHIVFEDIEDIENTNSTAIVVQSRICRKCYLFETRPVGETLP